MADAPQRSLDGLNLRPVATAVHGEIDPETARYSGGTVRLGFLVATRSGDQLAWRYAQLSNDGRLDGGRSLCELSRLADGRIKLVEHFTWESREGSGTNLLEQIA